MQVVTTPGRTAEDESVVISATCEHCKTQHATVPKDQPKCVSCEKVSCPECFHQMEFDYCDRCDAVLCKKCWRGLNGSKICTKPECRGAAHKAIDTAQLAAYQQQKKFHPLNRRSA